MIIFEYKVSPAWLTPDIDKETSYVRVTDDPKDNVTTFFFGKEYRHTIPEEDIEKIKDIMLGRTIINSEEVFDTK